MRRGHATPIEPVMLMVIIVLIVWFLSVNGFMVCQLALAQWGKNSISGVACHLLVYMYPWLHTYSVTKWLLIVCYSQVTFQAVLSSDGRTSFVTTIYGNVPQVRNVVSTIGAIVGFDAGDNSRSSSLSRSRTADLNSINTFRIDGRTLWTVYS